MRVVLARDASCFRIESFRMPKRRLLPSDSSALSEVLIEPFLIVIGEDEIAGWPPVTPGEARGRITKTLTSSNAAES
jgi:hypothetical protein